ncbi:hypothetical protein [Alkalihalobacillus sp. BA299]|uniref:hypothetical protein n=1 Tax=Alkalihalobacillus sp. BA299 TaxID=2815938 RepID=UPI001FFE16FD|nr:hypothetical protein [Alkalihalobacillus sp. BA299]
MVLSIFTMVIIFGVFIFLLAGLIGSRNPKGGGQGEMKDYLIKKTYYYLISFVTLMMVIGGSVAAFMAIADFVVPPTYHYDYYYEEQMYEKEHGSESTISPEEREERQEKAREQQRQNAKDLAINNLIKSLGWILIPLPIFIYFQRQIRRKETD